MPTCVPSSKCLDRAVTIDVRDKAVLLLSYATAPRRSELVALCVEDLDDHPGGHLVHVGRSKTDQEGSGHRIEVAYGDHITTCPVRAHRSWIDVAGIDGGPLFRSVSRGGKVGTEPAQ